MKSVSYESYAYLNCSACGGEVIVCVDDSKTVSGAPFIEMTLVSTDSVMDCCGRTKYLYGLTYDETLLVEPYRTNGLGCCDITGLFCKGCLTDWVEWLIDQIVVPEDTDCTNTPSEGGSLLVCYQGVKQTLSGGLLGQVPVVVDENTCTVAFQDLPSGLSCDGNENLIAGDVTIGGTGFNNSIFGCNAGFDITDSSYNTIMGTNAGSGGLVSGGYNVLLGSDAGQSLGSANPAEASYNVCIGAGSGIALTTGASNTYVGNRSGRDVRTGSNNTYIGASAGDTTAITATNATGVGHSALALTTGTTIYTVGVGVEAGYGSSATYAVHLGHQAGAYSTPANLITMGFRAGYLHSSGRVTSATDSIIIGVDAGRGLIGGSQIVIGPHAMETTDVSSGSDNIAIGYDALKNLGSGTGRCTAVGSGAGALMSAASCGNSTFVGYLAGNSVGGASNTFIGSQCGDSVQICSSSIGIGYNAFSATGTTGSNIAIGVNSGLFSGAGGVANSGCLNTVVGSEAGNVQYGKRCVSVGYNSCYTIASGTPNTQPEGTVAIGYGACYYATDYSVAIGINALRGSDNLSSGYNVAVGAQAGFSITTGAVNVAVGGNSLYAISTGGYNAALGHRAGDTITTGGYNTFLGSYTDAPAASTGSIAIGYKAEVNSNYTCVIGANSGAGNANGELNGIGCGTQTPTSYFSIYEKMGHSKEGGLMEKYTNKTGGVTVKGQVVTISSGTAQAVDKLAVDAVNPIGVFYEAGVADGSEAWVVIKGRAQVYCGAAATVGQMVRACKTAEAGAAAGIATATAVLASPVDASDLSRKLGFALETTGGAGLVWTHLV